MYTFDEVAKLLDDIIGKIPIEFLESLNKKIPSDNYWVLGEYCYSPVLGSKIYIYYGSFMALYVDTDIKTIREQLRSTVLHELRHHIERLAGYCDLELADEQFVEKALEQLNVRKDNNGGI